MGVFEKILMVMGIVGQVEQLIGPGKGKKKKEMAVALAGSIFNAAGVAVNPVLMASIGETVDATVGLLNEFGVLPKSKKSGSDDKTGKDEKSSQDKKGKK